MARGGRVTTVVLGAFQVSEKGDLANWNVPASGKGGSGARWTWPPARARVLVVTYHTTRLERSSSASALTRSPRLHACETS